MTPTQTDGAGPEGPLASLIRIASSTQRVADAFATVPYRGHWFYLDDRDMASKRLFTFLMFVFTLVEAPGKEGAPLS